MENKGILVVSFGTSYQKAAENSIYKLEAMAEERFHPCPVYKAYTSNIVRKILARRGEEVADIKTAFSKMKADGIKKVCILPTLLVYGEEYDKIKKTVEESKDEFDEITVGTPLLGGIEDMKEIAHVLGSKYKTEPDECLILMGHGTRHYSNMSYPAMEYICHEQGFPHIFIGTVEAYPDLEVVIKKAKNAGMKKATLIPFMFVAGDHAINDMVENEDSWLALLQEAGFEVKPVLKGLGEYEGIRELYLSHILI